MIVETKYSPKYKKLHVSHIVKGGQLKIKSYDWETPYKFRECDPNDKDIDTRYHSWEGKPVKRVYGERPDRYCIYDFLDNLPKAEQDELHQLHMPDIYFIDIETEVVDGFPDPGTAPTMIQSISIVHNKTVWLYGLKPLSEDTIKRIEDNTNKYFDEDEDEKYEVRYMQFKTEFRMLRYFFHKNLPTYPCITGWNFIDFDLRFLMNRARKLSEVINGVTYTIDVRLASHTKQINHLYKTPYEFPAHKLVFDYMMLYKSLDTSVKVKESNSLDFVSQELLGVKKIEYTGTLMELYEEDFEKFMYYNAVDSILVQKIHEKGKYLDIICAIASLANIQANDVYSFKNNNLASLAITEGVLRRGFREELDVVLFKLSQEERETKMLQRTLRTSDGTEIPENNTIEGGWVKAPAVGMNSWVACYDFASLYPTTQRQFYIAPENFIGVSPNKDDEYYQNAYGHPVKIDHDKDVIIKVENKAVDEDSPFRFLYKAFKKEHSPTLKMLEDVYSQRKKEKKKMMGYKFELSEMEHELEKLNQEL